MPGPGQRDGGTRPVTPHPAYAGASSPTEDRAAGSGSGGRWR